MGWTPKFEGRRRGLRATRRVLLLGAAILAAPLLSLMVASPAVAGLNKEFSVFNDCPVTVPGVVGCVISYTTSGEFHLGNKTVPINQTITLQGGLSETTPNLVPAADGNTLSKTPLALPGGLIGVELLPPLTSVTVTAELAGPVGLHIANLFAAKGAAVSLPLKAKLDNPALGSSCYVGSESSPVAPQLTSGTTKPPESVEPITGNPGKLEFTGGGNIIVVNGASLVDNTFSAPGAEGCAGVLSLVVDPSVDLVAGLPAGPGKNSAVLNTKFENVSSRLVVAQREVPEVGTCVKVPPVKEGKTKVFNGSFEDKGCLNPSKGGEYEWTTGPPKTPTFTTTAGATTLETVGGTATLKCKKASGAGQYTGAKTATATITLTGCKLSSKETCQSSGAAPGEIVTSPLDGSLGFITDAVEKETLAVSVGLDLRHEGSILTAVCGSGTKVTVAGSVIAPIGTIDKMSSVSSLVFTAAGGKQAPEQFEEEPKDTLAATVGGGSPTQAGLSSNAKLKYAEPLEIKAIAH
jgi:hypothetical protein